MTVLVVGGSGATGRLLLAELLARGQVVRTIVRSPDSLPEAIRDHDQLSIVQASLLDLSDDAMRQQVGDCSAVASCLGHNLTFKGMYGAPRMLVTEATRRLCEAVRASGPQAPVRYVLMNTAGNSNRDLQESLTIGHRLVVGLIRALVPPHRDNERAADYLRTRIGSKDPLIEWAAVRPDSLVDEDSVSEYVVHPSPTRSAIFDAGRTSRINVAHFMAELMTDDALWRQWKGRMPVIYNQGFS